MRQQYTVNLGNTADFYRFREIIKSIVYEVDVEQDRYNVNGKSEFGLLSLDLTKDVRVTVRGDVEPMTAYALENCNQMTRMVK